MKLFLMLFVIYFGLNTSKAYSTFRFKRFIGGFNAKEKQFPYIVSLRVISTNRHFCGGSIINENFVLSAAHCFRRIDPDNVYIAAGSLYKDSYEKRYTIADIKFHPDYNAEKILNDLVLIKLNEDIDYSAHIQKISLYNEYIPIGTQMTVSGWGRKTSNADNSYILQYSNVTSISLKRCQIMFPKATLHTKHICAYDYDISFCYGDSGGPLVYDNKLAGVVSKMAKDCDISYPNVYVKISDYSDWIIETMKDMKEEESNEIVITMSPSHLNKTKILRSKIGILTQTFNKQKIETVTESPSKKIDSKKVVKYWKNIMKYMYL